MFSRFSPEEHVKKYNQVYPGVFDSIDAFTFPKTKKSLGDWPNWCYCPLAGAYAALSKMLNNAKNPGVTINDLAVDIGNIGALATWRKTKGVYRFDKSLLRELLKTEITGDIPSEILFRLPEWCIYVEIPKDVLDSEMIIGFFAYLEYDVNTKGKELRIVLDLETGLNCQVVHLVGSLQAGIEQTLFNSLEIGKATGLLTAEQISRLGKTDPYSSMMSKILSPFISLVLYICAESGEIRNSTGGFNQPKNPKVSKSGKVFTSEQVKTWEVGFRVGAALRASQQKVDQEEKESTLLGAHSRPRPHIRRAHWHTYWTGTKPEQKPVLKWLPPIPINISEDNSNIVTIKEVR